jgi:hypothetical protein
MSRIKCAEYNNIEGCIAITYDNIEDQNKHVDYIYSEPVGGWRLLKFYEGISYIRFLDLMVKKNQDVYRKLARLALTNFLWGHSDGSGLIKVMNAMVILDSTFRPPYINLNSQWQREFLFHIAHTESYNLVGKCLSDSRLDSFFRALS